MTRLPSPRRASENSGRTRSCSNEARSALVLATELGGRCSGECRELMRLLVDHRARRVAPAVRPAARSGWLRRWWGMLSVAVQHATALGCDCWRHPWQPAGDAGPPLADILDLADPAAPSQLPWATQGGSRHPVSPRASAPKKACEGKKRNILYLKWSLPLPYWLLDNVLYLKTVVCRTILFSEFEVCKVMIFYLKWSFPLPYWLLDHSFYLNMFCRTILFWELRNGTVNVFYLKLFFPLPHWLLDSIFYFKIVCRIILFWKFWVGIMNISYLKWSLPLPYWLLDNVLYLKTVCRTILFSEFEVCKVMVFYLKWSFPLPYWLLDHSFYIKMFCRTILFWEFRNGTMNVFYLKLFFPLPHWLLDNIFY